MNENETQQLNGGQSTGYTGQGTPYQVQPQGAYQQPYYPAPYPQYPYYRPVKTIGGSGWVIFLRVMAWIMFVVILVLGILLGGWVFGGMSRFDDGGMIGGFFLSIPIAFMMVAHQMAWLDSVADTRAIRSMLKAHFDAQQKPISPMPSSGTPNMPGTPGQGVQQ